MKKKFIDIKIKNIMVGVFRSCLFKLLVVVMVFIIISTGILFYNGGLRYKVFRLVGEIPSTVYFYLFRGHVYRRDFAGAVQLLNKQLDYVQNISSGNNQVLPGLLKNIKFCIEHAETTDEYDQFQKFLYRFITLYPDIYEARVWYAKTLLNDSGSLVFEQVDAAIRLAGSDSMSYKVGIEAAQLYGEKEKFNKYCKQYNKNQLGGVTFFDRNLLFFGLGLRTIALKVEGKDGIEEYIENNGLRIGPKVNYEFILKRRVNLKKVKLYVGTQSGIIFKIHGIELSLNGFKIRKIEAKNLTMTTFDGYFLDKSSVFITSSNRVGAINFNLPVQNIDTYIDKIVISMGIRKAGITNNLKCGKIQ